MDGSIYGGNIFFSGEWYNSAVIPDRATEQQEKNKMGRLDTLQRKGANKGNTVVFNECENTVMCMCI